MTLLTNWCDNKNKTKQTIKKMTPFFFTSFKFNTSKFEF